LTLTTTTTSTTTTSTSTTTTTVPEKCQCKNLVVSASSVGTGQGELKPGGAKFSRVILEMKASLTCTHGLAGGCVGGVRVEGPVGATTGLFQAVPVVSKAGKHGFVAGRPLAGVGVECSGPCDETTARVFFVKADFHILLAGETVVFNFVSTCSGEQTYHQVELVYNAGGDLVRGKSKL
jgi:hypothetical protein